MSTSTHSSPFTRRRVSAALLAALFILGSGTANQQAVHITLGPVHTARFGATR